MNIKIIDIDKLHYTTAKYLESQYDLEASFWSFPPSEDEHKEYLRSILLKVGCDIE